MNTEMQAKTTAPAPCKRGWRFHLAVWGLSALFTLCLLAGGWVLWLTGWRLGDAGVDSCRDPEMQQVLRRLDARLCSRELAAEMRQGAVEERRVARAAFREMEREPRSSDMKVYLDGVEEEAGVALEVEMLLRDHVAPYRKLIRRAAEEGRVDVSDGEGRSLLYGALTFGCPEAAPYLLEHGSDPNLVFRHEMLPDNDETPLTAALCMSGKAGTVAPAEQLIPLLSLMCRHGADWEKMPRAEMFWTLRLIYSEKLGEGAKLLRAGLELGYRPKMYTRDGAGLFEQVGKLPQAVELLQELQRLGFLKEDWNCPLVEAFTISYVEEGDEDDRREVPALTPLGLAVAAKNPALVAWLLEQGAAPDSARDSLVKCIGSCRKPEDAEKLADILGLLLKHGLTLPAADSFPFDKLPPHAAGLLRQAAPPEPWTACVW